ncbi:rhodanese-like domain-containing protein [Luteimonas sp. e5]
MNLTAADLVADARSRIREVAPAQFHADRGDAVLIDVREPAEFETGHVPGAINIPRGVLEFQVDAHPAVACATDPALAHRGRPLVVYCLSGGRAALSVDNLQKLGFSDVRSLAGGIEGWRQAGLPVTSR